LLKLILFLQIVLLILFFGVGYFVYLEIGAISSALEEATGVIAEIQNLLPKLEVAVDTVISLEAAFQSLAGVNDLLNMLLDPFHGNS